MKRFLIAPDSFKGSMTAVEVCEIIKRALVRHIPDAQVELLPIADGGEGTVDCFLKCKKGVRIGAYATGSDFEKIYTEYAIIEDGKTAVIELAAVAGLPLLKSKKNPAKTTTYGVGELMKDAIWRGCKRIILALGGSATNDAGVGFAAALGVRFYNSAGEAFIPVGENLSEIANFCTKDAETLLAGVEVSAMCDVTNPLHGKNGAAHIFARQKGADDAMVSMLDEQLKSFSELVYRQTGIKTNEIICGGAAGGAGAGVVIFSGAKLERGIDAVLDMVDFDVKAKNKQLIITGEGKIDAQSLDGKAVIGVARRAKALGIPVAVIAGDLGENIERVYDEGVSFVLSTNRVANEFEKVRHRSAEDLSICADTLMRIIETVMNITQI